MFNDLNKFSDELYSGRFRALGLYFGWFIYSPQIISVGLRSWVTNVSGQK